ncbi:MAG: hypothetical protein J6T98_01790 [Salinivirgaceae bacterium]|nr:hypothetical protein [Salinivirgaceae bacterium]
MFSVFSWGRWLHISNDETAVIKADSPLTNPHFNDKDVCIRFDHKVERVEAGFICRIPQITQLGIYPTMKDLNLNTNDLNLLHQNNVIIVGYFDTIAEEIAKKHHLRFMPADLTISSSGDYFTQYGNYILTLRFWECNAALHNDCRSQGGSAGWMGGGEHTEDLDDDFYKDPDIIEKMVELCWGTFATDIRESQPLKNFLAAAKERYATLSHNGFVINY